jgi:hypothetical protein
MYTKTGKQFLPALNIEKSIPKTYQQVEIPIPGGRTPINSNLLNEWVKIFYGDSTAP